MMQINEEKSGAVTVVKPAGPLVMAEVDQFRDRLMQVRAASMGRFVIDASTMSFVDSTGLEVLADLQDELAQSGQFLKLCGVNETVREVLDLTELASMFEMFHDVSSAVRSFH